MEEFEVLPGIGEFDTERLLALGFSSGDVRRMVDTTVADTSALLEADEAIDAAFGAVLAEIMVQVSADETIENARTKIEAEDLSVQKCAADVVDAASVVIEAEHILGNFSE